MESIFNTRKFLISDADRSQYQELLKGLEIDNDQTHKVVLLNDDKTPMAFVSILFLLFQDIQAREAKDRMMKIHESGVGDLVRANRELAENITSFVIRYAKNHNHPLEVQVHDI